MKPLALFVAGSLVLNAVLVVLIVTGAGEAPRSAVPTAPTAAPAASKATAAPGLETWQGLSTSDLPALRDRLGAEGFPPAMVRAILAAQIRAGFAARRKALELAQANTPFWKNPVPDPKSLAELRALYKEEQNTLKALLGPDPENGPAATLRKQFADWPAETIDSVAAIQDRFNEQRQDLYGSRPGSITPNEREKMAALEKAAHAEIAAVLSPAELENYDLRTSKTANNLRFNLMAFDATEAEYRAIYRLQAAFDDQFSNSYGAGSLEQMKARQDAQPLLDADLKAALGADRYADYQRATDYNYRQATQLVARLELPAETSNQLYAVQKEFQQRLQDLFQNRGAGGATRINEQRAALLQEATAKLTPLLGGTRGFDAYKQYGGSWLQSLQPPRPAPGK